jgi:hypothetical protein
MKVHEIKAMLNTLGIAKHGCLEKGDLIAILACFDKYRQCALDELQALCVEHSGHPCETVTQCAAFLANPPIVRTMAAPAQKETQPPPNRCDGNHEAQRILQLRKDDFPTCMAWAFTTLAVPIGTTEFAPVQQAYRQLMRGFHPDRNRHATEEETRSMKAAMELIAAAKEECEHCLGDVVKPSAPAYMSCSILDYTMGCRSFELIWPAAQEARNSIIQRYELWFVLPDDDDETERIEIVEPCGRTQYSFVIDEVDYAELPVWDQPDLRVILTAGNSAGLSDPIEVWIPLFQ